MTSLLKPLVEISHMGGTTRAALRRRWQLHFSLPPRLEVLLKMGQPIPFWEPIEVYETECPAAEEDMPWVTLSISVISGQFKNLLDRVAPEHAQFLPVKIRRLPDKPELRDSYWMVNWLKAIDCIDRLRSSYEPLRSDPSVHVFGRLVIDEQMVPRDCLVFRVRHFNVVTLMRQELRKAIIAEGISGPQWLPVLLSSDPVDFVSEQLKLRDPGKDYILPYDP